MKAESGLIEWLLPVGTAGISSRTRPPLSSGPVMSARLGTTLIRSHVSTYAATSVRAENRQFRYGSPFMFGVLRHRPK